MLRHAEGMLAEVALAVADFGCMQGLAVRIRILLDLVVGLYP